MGMTSPLCRPSAAADVRITKGPLSVDAALKSVRSTERGGVSVFVGDVRGTEGGQTIAAIHYEAYEEMALAEMARIVRAAEGRWNAAVAVQHRVGRVPAGETAIVVAAAAAHRAEAFAACREVTDAVKSQVPLWKTSFEALP